ncbi:hypothetical protein [Dactylosporangium sp. NPDC049140]|uniref:hypothetical protein n=1 Tax=Dactylosporangium sp. NPDC049140 TaxID=3155647 RepID=UPI0033FA82B4
MPKRSGTLDLQTRTPLPTWDEVLDVLDADEPNGSVKKTALARGGGWGDRSSLIMLRQGVNGALPTDDRTLT